MPFDTDEFKGWTYGPMMTGPSTYTWGPRPKTLDETYFGSYTRSDIENVIKHAEEVHTIMEKRHNAIDKTEEYAVACSYEADLLPDRILKSIALMKSKLMMQCAPIRVRNIECTMTPAVKENLISAHKKLEMYGKKIPIIASYDEYGRRLPDKINIEVMEGMTIKIVDPKDYGELYIAFKGVIDSYNEYNNISIDIDRDMDDIDSYTVIDDLDCPF